MESYFDISPENVHDYIITLANSGNIAKKLENKIGLPRSKFNISFAYNLREVYKDLEMEIIKEVILLHK